MARDFIKVDPSQSVATAARLLLSYKDALRSAYEQGKRVLSIMQHNVDDGAPADADWSGLETLFGLPKGAGPAVYGMVNGSIGSMEGGVFKQADAKNLTETLG
jgi:hypothetical protein